MAGLTLEQRLLARRLVTPHDCWEWTGARMTGRAEGQGNYGRIWVAGRVLVTHRVAYELWVGAIPEGLTLDHLCRNPPCFNPAHLEPVTNAENARRGDGWAGQHARRESCVHGHPLSGENLRLQARPFGVERVCRRCAHDRLRAHRLRRAAP